MAFPFLSDQWIEEARRIRAGYEGRHPAPPVAVRMNVVVTDVPWPPGRVEGHVATGGDSVDLEVGRLEQADVTVTMEHATARALLLGGDPEAAMQAFLTGRIRVDGDLTKLMFAFTQPSPVTDPVVGVFGRLREITE
ncbi:MAG: SCP2 sterol-binding domain-containing protein [Actinomycetota bacterium]|nr:SCP2 sterol-binding domain-containing protein [Actinomycetota bacterium]